jgi:hypothetical protein
VGVEAYLARRRTLYERGKRWIRHAGVVLGSVRNVFTCRSGCCECLGLSVKVAEVKSRAALGETKGPAGAQGPAPSHFQVSVNVRTTDGTIRME